MRSTPTSLFGAMREVFLQPCRRQYALRPLLRGSAHLSECVRSYMVAKSIRIIQSPDNTKPDNPESNTGLENYLNLI